MNQSPNPEHVSAELMHFIRETFLDGDPGGELTEDSPLIEWGVLNSLNSAILLNFIHREFIGRVNLERISAAGFKDVRSITALLCERP